MARSFTERFKDVPSGLYQNRNPKSGIQWEYKVERLPMDHPRAPGMLTVEERKVGTEEWQPSSFNRAAAILTAIRKELKGKSEHR